jgi:hypothetical protein
MAGIEVVLNYTLNGANVPEGATTPISCAGSVGAGNPLDDTLPGNSLKDIYTGASLSKLNQIGSGVCGGDETLGAGIRWSNKSFLVYFDYLDPDEYGIGSIKADNYTPADESIMKIGGKWTAKQFWLSAQYEAAEDQTGGDYMFFGGNFDINKNNAIMATVGQHTDLSMGYAIGYTHKMSKQTKVYIDYSAITDELDATIRDNIGGAPNTEKFDDSVIALGFVKSF